MESREAQSVIEHWNTFHPDKLNLLERIVFNVFVYRWSKKGAISSETKLLDFYDTRTGQSLLHELD